MTYFLLDILPLILLMLTMCALTAWIIIKSGVRTFFKFLLIPAMLSIAYAVPLTFASLMGHAVWLPLPEKAVVLGHNVLVKNDKKTAIELWLRGPTQTRLHIIPYSKEAEEQLEKARKGRAAGLVGELSGKKGNQANSTDKYPFALELKIPSYGSNKQPIENEPTTPPEPQAAPKFSA